MTDPLLSVFPPPLLRIILCGGDGLAPAYGPLLDADGVEYVWSPTDMGALGQPRVNGDAECADPLAYPICWSLPLDHWRSRLALVAAWMLTTRPLIIESARAVTNGEALSLILWTGAFQYDFLWTCSGQPLATGRVAQLTRMMGAPLPTLPIHLRDHDPAVALLLALYDVPEIKARIAP